MKEKGIKIKYNITFCDLYINSCNGENEKDVVIIQNVYPAIIKENI